MTKTTLAVATALLAGATFLSSAAEACISCNYVPEVARSESPAKPPKAKRVEKKRAYTADKNRAARPSQKRAVKSAPVTDEADTSAAGGAKTAPVERQADPETSDTSTTALASPEATPSAQPKAGWGGRLQEILRNGWHDRDGALRVSSAHLARAWPVRNWGAVARALARTPPAGHILARLGKTPSSIIDQRESKGVRTGAEKVMWASGWRGLCGRFRQIVVQG